MTKREITKTGPFLKNKDLLFNTVKENQKDSLREKCPNTECFLVRIFLYSVRIQENTDQKKFRIWTLFTQCFTLKNLALKKLVTVKHFGKLSIHTSVIKIVNLLKL